MFKKISLFVLIFGVWSCAYALDLHKVSQNALKEHKLILLSVESEDCTFCRKMNKETFAPQENHLKIVNQYIQQIVIVEKTKLPANMKTEYFPTSYILDPKDMSIVDKFVGYMKPDDFLSLIDIVYEQEVSN